ncbi:MAG: hypothetical protein LBF97_07325 [Elusimicrobiota bacterium]|jgi:hypothetical protein|nr:hypothetical protein [Elusimicrobiota bacterium]
MFNFVQNNKIKIIIGILVLISVFIYIKTKNNKIDKDIDFKKNCYYPIYYPDGRKLFEVDCIQSVDINKIMYKSKQQVDNYLGDEYINDEFKKATSAVYYQGGGIQIKYENDIVIAIRISTTNIEFSLDKILNYLNVKRDINEMEYFKTSINFGFELSTDSKNFHCSASLDKDKKFVDTIVCLS